MFWENIKKYLSLVIIGVIILAVIVVLIVKAIIGHPNPVADATKTEPGYTIIQACSLLTKDNAATLVGVNATPASSNGAGEASKDVYVSICSYSNGGSAGPTGITSVDVLTRSAKDKAGSVSNQSGIKSYKAKSNQTVSIHGHTAYWIQKNGQLYLLDKNDMIIITADGVSSNVADNSLTNAVQAANLMVSK